MKKFIPLVFILLLPFFAKSQISISGAKKTTYSNIKGPLVLDSDSDIVINGLVDSNFTKKGSQAVYIYNCFRVRINGMILKNVSNGFYVLNSSFISFINPVIINVNGKGKFTIFFDAIEKGEEVYITYEEA